MKRMILVALAAVLLAVPAVEAQKVNKSAIVGKLQKSDADIADAKKNAKASTWMNRGKVYYEAAVAPTKDVFVGMETMMLKMTAGEPQSVGQETLAGVAYESWVYPFVTVYVKDGKVATWTETQTVYEGAGQVAVEAYLKAHSMDQKQAEKVKEGMQQLANYYSQLGNTSLDAARYADAADGYLNAHNILSNPVMGEKQDGTLIYYAGYLRTMDGANNPESFVKGAKHLEDALAMNYADDEGNIYYYLFHCYYGQKDADKAFILKSKDALLAGIEKFPSNERILEGLMSLYTTEEGVGDPQDLVAMLDSQLAQNPTSVDLWFGRGRLFYALKDYEKSIESFQKVAELKPELYEGWFYLGLFYTLRGDQQNNVINEKQYTSQAAYDADLEAVNAIYRQAIPAFEKALEIQPNSVDTLESLKAICFRLRDEAGMMDKYTKYNEAWKAAKGQ
ncbi:MAG: tetratricopeptide repeat protein [Alistipes sp.]|nr:tetratricopeptide repeat protein [Alistipes sp.]